jgi:hypothetical protein
MRVMVGGGLRGVLMAGVVAAALGWTQPMLAAPVAEARAATVIPLMRYLGSLWSFQLEVAGKKELFLLDTAGGLTVITPATAAEIGCRPWGQLTGFRMRGDRVDAKRCDHVVMVADGAKLELPTAGVFDIGSLLPKDAPSLAGSVALDAFAGRAITLDFPNQRLIVETPASLQARVGSATEVPVQFSREAGGFALTPEVPVDTSSGRAWMEMDCGSDAPVIVGRHIAGLLGLNPELKGGQDLSFSLAGGVPVRGRAHVQDLILDGNIGTPVLDRWVVTIDLAHQRLWIKAVGDGRT